LRAPSGGGPIARETEHGEQKQIRRAGDFWRGLIPTVWANIKTPTDLCPVSSSRLQRRQHRCSKGPPPSGQLPQQNTTFVPWRALVDRKVPGAVAVQARNDFILRRYAIGSFRSSLQDHCRRAKPSAPLGSFLWSESMYLRAPPRRKAMVFSPGTLTPRGRYRPTIWRLNRLT
jgi:hypothetical protein